MTDYTKAALELAHEALYRTSPNPRVGCVLVAEDGAGFLSDGAAVTVKAAPAARPAPAAKP